MIIKTIKDILDFAINEEKYFTNFYKKTINEVKNSESKKILAKIAKQEENHKLKLENIKNSLPNTVCNTIQDIIISKNKNNSKRTDLNQFADKFKIIDYAIEAERDAQDLYNKLSHKIPQEDCKRLLQVLAIEEKKHEKYLMEIKRKENENK